MTIPASQLVAVNPNVLSAGGNALALNGLILTESTRVPIGAVLSFPNDGISVSNYFGPAAEETAAAAIYFAGFNGSTRKPGAILFAQYPGTAVGAYLRGGPVGAALTLTQLQALTAGTLTISVNGTPLTSGSISLSAATSFSDAATIIAAAFTSPPFGVTYDAVAKAFVFLTTATGASELIAFPTTDALATSLQLTQATGAVLSQGADAAVPGTYMDNLIQLTQDWATFMTIFDPDASGNTVKLAFATWTNAQNKRFAYVVWDTDITPTKSADATTSLGNIIGVEGLNGTCCIFGDQTIAAFICGAAASIDFSAVNGRITFAFRGQDGLVADVTDAISANNLIANGYNFYGAYATAAQQFLEFQPGSVSGEFLWLDSYVDEIWLNSQLQLALMVLLQNTNSIPYNQAGYEMIKSACADPINAALNFGAIRTGVTLSASQIAAVNAAAGVTISDVLQSQGWYLQVVNAAPLTRQARKSPPINFFYMDGEAIQQIVLNSILIQ